MGGSRPDSRLSPLWHNIPDELSELHQWLLWRWKRRANGTFTKPPLQPDGSFASVDDPETWARFDYVQTAYLTSLGTDREFDGVGFVLTQSDPFCGFDFDGCLNANCEISVARIAEFVAALDSYTEISPSRSGLRVVVRAKLPPGGRDRNGCECYESGRYLTITGSVFQGRAKIYDRQDQVNAIHAAVFGSEEENQHKGGAKQSITSGHSSTNLDDAELLRQARQAGNGRHFCALFDDGDTSGFRSPSEADLRLCTWLAFWCGRDAGRIDVLFRQSALMRVRRWDKGRYRELTINKAIELCSNVYTPRVYAK